MVNSTRRSFIDNRDWVSSRPSSSAWGCFWRLRFGLQLNCWAQFMSGLSACGYVQIIRIDIKQAFQIFAYITIKLFEKHNFSSLIFGSSKIIKHLQTHSIWISIVSPSKLCLNKRDKSNEGFHFLLSRQIPLLFIWAEMLSAFFLLALRDSPLIKQFNYEWMVDDQSELNDFREWLVKLPNNSSELTSNRRHWELWNGKVFLLTITKIFLHQPSKAQDMLRSLLHEK